MELSGRFVRCPGVALLRRDTRQSDLYDELATTWWDESGTLHGLGVLLDPVRLPFIVGLLRTKLGGGSRRVLDLGAGGGSLSEALDGNGCSVVALDPSLLSLQAGFAHGVSVGSTVRFVGGDGGQLPFADACFDAVLCMEVLEHIDNPGAVVAEAARVLRPGGLFIFSGPNRTVLNRIGLLVIAQDLLGVVPRGTHQWHRLLRPADMERHLRAAGIAPGGILGVGMGVRSLPRFAGAVLGLLTRRLTYAEAARRIDLVAGTGKSIAYQGYGLRD